jgi:hypothetical protein
MAHSFRAYGHLHHCGAAPIGVYLRLFVHRWCRDSGLLESCEAGLSPTPRRVENCGRLQELGDSARRSSRAGKKARQECRARQAQGCATSVADIFR